MNEDPGEIQFKSKYQILFKLVKNPEEFKEVDTVIITGGRGSGKSLTTACVSVLASLDNYWKFIYTRFTATSIGDSVREEVQSAIEMLGLESEFITLNREIYDRHKNLRFSFKGLKTGSRHQKANLKSIKGFNAWVLDEAEECPDYDTWQRIFLSLRHPKKKNISMLLLNPTYKQHWIYKTFFVEKGVEAGFCGVKENILYIHTSYLDLPAGALPDTILKYYDKMKDENPKMYDNIVLGGWLDRPEGVLLPIDDLNLVPEHKGSRIKRVVYIDPSEKGGDMMTAIFTDIAMVDNKLTVHVFDAVHSNAGYEILSQLIHNKAVESDIDEIIVEKNGVGVATVFALNNLNDNNYRLVPFHSKVKKEVRIISNYEFVKKHFTFRSDYYNDKMYNKFIEHLTQFTIEDPEPHTVDAIDACTSFSRILKEIYKKLI